MNKLYTFLLPVVGLASTTWAMDNNNNQVMTANADNIYYSVQITPETIEILGPQIPESFRQSYSQFITQYPNLLATLVKFEPKELARLNKAQLRDKLTEGHVALKTAGIQNHSNNSFIFPLPNNSHIILQASGPVHKMYNLSGTINGIGNGWNHCAQHYMEGNKLEELQTVDPTTYQTISRKAYYLMISQTLSKMSNPSVVVSSTYVVPVDSSKIYTKVTDATHVVLQEAFDTNRFLPVRTKNDSQKTAQNVTLIADKAIADLCTVIAAVKLFDTNNIHVDKHNGDILITDLEQPNDEPSATFFHNRNHQLAKDYEKGNKGKTKAEHDAQMGFNTLLQLLATNNSNPHKFDLVKSFINDRNNFPGYSEAGYQEIRDLLNK